MGSVSLSGKPLPLYVCVNIPEFPAQARLRFRPEQAALPVAILDGDAPLEQVCSANSLALKLGVAHGMTRAELDSFPEVQSIRRSPAEEAATRAALLSAGGAFTPRTQICAPAQASIPTRLAAFACVLDMTGASRMFGPVAKTAQSIAEAVRSLRLYSRIAVSSNYHAAVCASAYAGKTPLVMEEGREREALSKLPLAALGLSEAQQSVFDLWGIRSMGELAALPEEDLVVRLGQEGRRLHLLARGEHPHLMVPEEPVFTLEENIAFDTPVDMLDSLFFVLGPMLDQLLLRAGAYALALASLTVKLTLDGGGEHVRTLKPALPLTDREVLLKLLLLDLQAHPPSAGVMTVHLHAEPGKRSKVQAGLFSPPLPEPMRLDVTLARIAALVGEDRVGKARLLDTHRSDGFVVERFTVPACAPKENAVQSALTMRRLRPSVQLTMQMEQNVPLAFFFQGKRYQVTQSYGPWRRSGEWWSQDFWALEEWDVCAVANDGETLLGIVLKNRLQKVWQLEALYD